MINTVRLSDDQTRVEMVAQEMGMQRRYSISIGEAEYIYERLKIILKKK